MGSDRLVLTEQPLDPKSLLEGLNGQEDGALVTFAGIVRVTEGDQTLAAIDYQAYTEMAKPALSELLTEAHRKWPRFQAAVAHRTGLVPVGEASVFVAVAAGHRAEAFEVSRFLIDELKARVPIWKREHIPASEPTPGPATDRSTKSPPGSSTPPGQA